VPTHPVPAWQRLGELLVRRRIELDTRYANRQKFTAERGVNYRTVSDIETGRRDNYEPRTFAELEVAYGLAPGSISRALAGGELDLPVPPSTPPACPPAAAPAYGDLGPEAQGDTAWRLFPSPGDRAKREIWRLPAALYSEEDRGLLIEALDEARRDAAPPGAREETGLSDPAPLALVAK
jgi:hypothetical protein